MREDSDYLYKEQHPACGSSDGLARYSDGHGYCFACGNYESGDGEDKKKGVKKISQLVPFGEYKELSARQITEETCKKLKYFYNDYCYKNELGKSQTRRAQIVNIPDQAGNIVAQKIRMKPKDFRFIGDTKNCGLVFQDLWAPGGKILVITEGEIDALSVSQVQGNKYPVVSIPNGTKAAREVCKRSYDFINSFEKVVFMFDMDEPGREAAKECAQLFPGKSYLPQLSMKDANELLVAGKVKEIIQAVFTKHLYRPDGIVTLSSLRDRVLEKVEQGKPWVFETLTELTKGRRPGELYFIGAGSGIGKTDFMTQQAVADIQSGDGIAMFLLEQPVVETAKRLCGKFAGKRFHVFDDDWTEEELLKAFDSLDSYPCYLYDHFGAKDWETIKSNIRFLAKTENVKHFYVDHLTALVANAEDERRTLDKVTVEMSSVAQELLVNLYVISHLATPEGKSHEEGGRVQGKHFKGSRSVLYYGHFLFGLERDTQAEDKKERNITTFRVIKDRQTGQATGETFQLTYNAENGLLEEKDIDCPFGTHEEEEDF